MFSRTTIGAIVAAVLMISFGASPVAAQSFGDLQSQIQALLARVAELTKQLNSLREGQQILNSFNTPQTTSPVAPWRHRICHLLIRDLRAGAQGDDVRGLQEFLQEQKFLTVAPTGYFGLMTTEAVRKWQATQGVSTVGAFGPMSRERIKIWCGGGGTVNTRFNVAPSVGKAPLTVTFKALVGGFTPYRYAIDFGDGTTPQEVRCPENPNLPDICGGPAVVNHTYQNNGQYIAMLWQFSAGGAVTDSTRTQLGQETIRVGSDACTKEYRPVCGSKPIVCITTPCNPIQQTYSNRCTMEADGASFLYEGQCRADLDPSADRRCKSWYDGCNTCSRETPGGIAMCTLRACFAPGPKYCTAYFDEGTNKSPTISEFSGPTTLSLNQNGTWTIKASDPENQILKYRVTWGDEARAVSPYQSSAALGSVVQTTTFTHAYSVAGTYTVLIAVIDEVGNEAKSSTTVQVGGPVACTFEYNPVCGQPPEPACRYSIPACMVATPGPQTYSNRCFMNAAGATFVHEGQCQSGGYACTADAYQCPNGTWVGRTGANCQFVCS